jgi:hypothetical protein
MADLGLRDDMSRMCLHYAKVMPELRDSQSLKELESCITDTHFLRIHQRVECWPVVAKCLKERRLPQGIVDVVYEFVNTVGNHTYNPLMICVSQSNYSREIRKNLVGSPPCAIEFLGGCTEHRDDVDPEKLTYREKISYKINTNVVDELWVEEVVYPTIKQLKDWVTVFSALCYDNDGNYWVYAFFFSTFSEREDADHVIEFGWRVNVPSGRAVEAITWLKQHNVDLNLQTGEISIESFDMNG